MTKPRALMATGVLVALAGYLTLNTKLILAYRGGTLANVHALCGNAFIQAIAHGSGECSTISSYYTLATVALWGGLALAGVGLVFELMRRNRPAVTTGGDEAR